MLSLVVDSITTEWIVVVHQACGSGGSAMRERNRGVVALLVVLSVGLGLASRRYPGNLPPFVADYAGDTLWAATVFWCIALVRRRLGTGVVALSTLMFAFLVEFSQLYRAPWIDAVRGTPAGALALGSGFLWSDLVCHVAGVAVAAAVDVLLVRRT